MGEWNIQVGNALTDSEFSSCGTCTTPYDKKMFTLEMENLSKWHLFHEAHSLDSVPSFNDRISGPLKLLYSGPCLNCQHSSSSKEHPCPTAAGNVLCAQNVSDVQKVLLLWSDRVFWVWNNLLSQIWPSVVVLLKPYWDVPERPAGNYCTCMVNTTNLFLEILREDLTKARPWLRNGMLPPWL